MTVFVGIDLAWGTRNASGICVIAGAECMVDCHVASVEELAAELDALGPDVVVGIDAPLIVESGRSAEAALALGMGRYGVYAHSSAAAVKAGYDQGVRLARELQVRGFSLAPEVPAREAGRFALEVYPHAGHVVMFGLPRIMPYKQKRGRTAVGMNAELGRYREHLRGFLERHAPVLLGAPAVAELLDAGGLAGAARKRHEDQLDALTCALLAMLAWRDGLGQSDVFGAAATGYIAVPGLSRDPRFAVSAATGRERFEPPLTIVHRRADSIPHGRPFHIAPALQHGQRGILREPHVEPRKPAQPEGRPPGAPNSLRMPAKRAETSNGIGAARVSKRLVLN
ncbi:MAG: DUF429 domain-containing protein [Dehalococcoidia bacterium]